MNTLRKLRFCTYLFVFYVVSNLTLNAETKIPFNSIINKENGVIEAHSDSLKIDSNSGKATFTGNVEIKHNNIILKAQKVIVNYSFGNDSRQSIKEILAVEDVVFISNEDVTKADHAIYNLTENTLKLSGNILIKQGTANFSGNELNINLNTGKGIISGRVKAVLGADEE